MPRWPVRGSATERFSGECLDARKGRSGRIGVPGAAARRSDGGSGDRQDSVSLRRPTVLPRRYSLATCMRVFARDGFIDRYSANGWCSPVPCGF
jgi:hypothetical protein